MALRSYIPRVGIERFTHNSNKRYFVSELSTLSDINVMSQLYDDACDVGFALENKKTGQIAYFYHADSEVDGEGDLIADIYYPIEESIRKYPRLKGYKLTLFND